MRVGNDGNRLDDEVVVKSDNLLKYKFNTSNHHKNTLVSFTLY